jgi:hypothetical protein
MPRLTHLALNTVASVVPALPPRLLGNTRLCAIVFLVRHRPNPTPLGVDDARFVCIVRDSYFTDWFHGATSGLDFWALADALIAARRAGKVNGQYLLFFLFCSCDLSFCPAISLNVLRLPDTRCRHWPPTLFTWVPAGLP